MELFFVSIVLINEELKKNDEKMNLIIDEGKVIVVAMSL
jgi:hypothetical protein